MIAAFQNEWVREIISPSNANTSVTINGAPIIIESRNKILGKNGNIGGKTGTEELAGHCFVGFYERDGRDVVTVVLKSEYGATGLNVFEDTEKIADYSYSAEKEITAPITLNEDVQYYKNDFNDAKASITYANDNKDAWSLSGNKEVMLTYSTPGYSMDVKGTINLSKMDLIKANLSLYILSIVIIVIIVVLLVLIIRLINTNKRRRRRRYY